MAKLGGGVDELEVDLLQSAATRLHQQRLETMSRLAWRPIRDLPSVKPLLVIR